MSYTRKAFGADIQYLLRSGYSPLDLSRWAFTRYLEAGSEIDANLEGVMMQIIVIQEGAEFEMSPDEIQSLAAELVSE